MQSIMSDGVQVVSGGAGQKKRKLVVVWQDGVPEIGGRRPGGPGLRQGRLRTAPATPKQAFAALRMGQAQQAGVQAQAFVGGEGFGLA